MPRSSPAPLRAITYLTPGLPLELFTAIAEHLSRRLRRPVELASEGRLSGPMGGDHDPFGAGEADLGFLCSPSYLHLRSLPVPTVELVRAGFVFDDPRNQGRPHYFSDVVVRADEPARSLTGLAGRVFGFNDASSLSGYHAMLQELAARAAPEGFFGEHRCTGSHAASIDALLEGTIDVAAVDSNVLAIELRRRPGLAGALRVVESLGPHPVQPTVIRSALAPALGPRIRAALLELPDAPVAGARVRAFGLRAAVPIDDGLFEEERRVLESLGRIDARRR